jgi:AbrB family looped-hinge helix DNA binding protein
MKSITVSSKNQVVIPSSVRAKLGIKSGDRLIIKQLTNAEVTLKKEPGYSDLVGIVTAQKEDATKRIRKLRDSWQ